MSSLLAGATLANGGMVRRDEIPALAWDDFADLLAALVAPPAATLSALFGVPEGSQKLRLYAVVSDARDGNVTVFSTVVGSRYPSLTPRTSQAHWFEREIAEQWGVVPEGHPWLKPIRYHRSYRPAADAWGRTERDKILPCVQPRGAEYFRIEGEEVHEVAVGPVHAGVIEPGHFRFQCHGELVYSLEIELGYQHRGVERELVGGPNKRTLHYIETLAGDTSVGHAVAYCQTYEALSGAIPEKRAEAIRVVALELERLANHVGDMGALAGDVGYQPTLSFCGRLRGDFLNATALICGNRFGRSLAVPGGVRFDVDDAMAAELVKRVAAAERDVVGATDLLWASSTVLARFEGTGIVSTETAAAAGLVGMAARASGVDRDVRRDFPTGGYRWAPIEPAVVGTGDVYARAWVRDQEIKRSCQFLRERLPALPAGERCVPVGELQPNCLAVSLVEGWRGEICHVALTDEAGRFARYKVVDPSFHNWIGLALALRNQEISDFPLCNKSFNLSYCGHDL